MEEKPRLAKDINFEEIALLSQSREYESRERSILIKKLAFAAESGRSDRFERLRQRFVKTYGDFNECERAGLDRLQEEYRRIGRILGIVL